MMMRPRSVNSSLDIAWSDRAWRRKWRRRRVSYGRSARTVPRSSAALRRRRLPSPPRRASKWLSSFCCSGGASGQHDGVLLLFYLHSLTLTKTTHWPWHVSLHVTLCICHSSLSYHHDIHAMLRSQKTNHSVCGLVRYTVRLQGTRYHITKMSDRDKANKIKRNHV